VFSVSQAFSHSFYTEMASVFVRCFAVAYSTLVRRLFEQHVIGKIVSVAEKTLLSGRLDAVDRP
jgi:hypothetical protein